MDLFQKGRGLKDEGRLGNRMKKELRYGVCMYQLPSVTKITHDDCAANITYQKKKKIGLCSLIHPQNLAQSPDLAEGFFYQ